MTFSHKIRPLQNTETNPVKKQEKKTIYFVIHSRSACYIFQSRFISRLVTYMVSLILNRLTFSLLFANLVWITAQSCGRRLEGCSIVTCKNCELRKRQQRTGAFEFVFYMLLVSHICSPSNVPQLMELDCECTEGNQQMITYSIIPNILAPTTRSIYIIDPHARMAAKRTCIFFRFVL